MAGRPRPTTPRRLPERSCVACRTPRPKADLVRVVRTAAGVVTIDPTGRLPGRGAYLCRDAACWTTAGRKRAIEHALKTSIPADVAFVLASGPDVPVAAAATIEPTHSVTGAHLMDAPNASPADKGGAHGQE